MPTSRRKASAQDQDQNHRRRSSSVTVALSQVPLNNQYQGYQSSPEVKPLPGRPRPLLSSRYRSRGLWNDVKTGRWLLIPSSAFKLSLITPILYLLQRFLTHTNVIPRDTFNIWEHLIFLSSKTEGSGNGLHATYAKDWWDLAFVLNYVFFWTFVRQSMTLHVFKPLAKSLGIKKGDKITRFTEQGYAFFYFGIMGAAGLYVMSTLPIWWFKVEQFWLSYPPTRMSCALKAYYLLQASYWVQQTVIMAAKVEKPRKDYNELIAHHTVTLWLIATSYTIYMTYIGVAIFVTMDVSDFFLGLAKCVNYVDDAWSVPLFAWFTIVWTYMRHYLNIKMLYSVYSQYNLIPVYYRTHYSPLQDRWLAQWTRWFIFIPIALLQALNLLWYALILRVLVRAVMGWERRDERSDDEDDGGLEDVEEKKE